jgi:muramoyltetrapeptide carboxypeptidase
MKASPTNPRKPKALTRGSKVALFAPASPADHQEILTGIAELRRLGFEFSPAPMSTPEGYFAGSLQTRLEGFLSALRDGAIHGLVATRGGYGASYLLGADFSSDLQHPKCIIGFSDLTSLQIYLWQQAAWVTFHGPMAAAGFNHGADDAHGYDEHSFLQAVSNTSTGWSVPLRAESLVPGQAEGRLLGGCLTIIQTSLGTPWELDTAGAILVLEDRGMKPYQVDRALLHLVQAGKFSGVKAIILGEFPNGETPPVEKPTTRDVCARILSPLGIPVIYGAPVGHSKRAMLTLPLGIRARLRAQEDGTLEFLEPAVVP